MRLTVRRSLPLYCPQLSKPSRKKTIEKQPPNLGLRIFEKVIVAPAPRRAKSGNFTGKLGLLILVIALFAIVGMGTTSLFRTSEVVVPHVDYNAELDKIMMVYPTVKYSFNESNGNLLLIGHVLKSTDKAQLLYNLDTLPFVRNKDDTNLIIDEGILQDINQQIGRNPLWRGVNMTAPSPGRFVLNGYLTTREQAEKLFDYIAQNFRFLDLLEKRVFVEEDEIASIRALLQEQGFKDVAVQMTNGELTLSGTITAGKGPILEKVIANF